MITFRYAGLFGADGSITNKEGKALFLSLPDSYRKLDQLILRDYINTVAEEGKFITVLGHNTYSELGGTALKKQLTDLKSYCLVSYPEDGADIVKKAYEAALKNQFKSVLVLGGASVYNHFIPVYSEGLFNYTEQQGGTKKVSETFSTKLQKLKSRVYDSPNNEFSSFILEAKI